MLGGRSTAPANDSYAPRPRGAGARPDPAALAEGLDRLREALLRRLDQIEAIAAEQAELGGLPPSDRERALREKLATLEASHARLVAEFRRREQEWEEDLARLEDDRRLLTEAWRRLEREQSEVAGRDGPDEPAPRPGHPPRAAAVAVAPAPAVYQPGADSVTTAILKEFEALRGDIRRNSKSASGR